MMIFVLLLPLVTAGPVDWLSVDLDIAESGAQFVERKSEPTYQVGLGIDFPLPVQTARMQKVLLKSFLMNLILCILTQAVNNVAIEEHEGRIFMGFRTSKNHFASPLTQLIIVSAPLDKNLTSLNFDWEHELTIEMAADLREPYFLSLPDRLVFYFFKAGTDPIVFDPDYIHRVEKVNGKWSKPLEVGGPGQGSK